MFKCSHQSSSRWSVIDTNISPIYAESISEFNELIKPYKEKAHYELVLTKSGNISQKSLWCMPCCKTWKRKNMINFMYVDSSSTIRICYSIAHDEKSSTDNEIVTKAINYFKPLLSLIPDDEHEEKTCIFKCPENKEATYYNYVNPYYTEMTINNTYSLDRNNSFIASLATVYPQCKEFVDKYYNERLQMKKNNDPEYKDFKLLGSVFVGWIKNKHRENAWAKIINDSNKTVHKLREYIESQGNTVLLVNTDAVKFIGHVPYENSDKLGEFKYEWENALMYIKGVKSYAYTDKENNWKIKQAGKCKLDKIKPNRDDWTLEEWKSGSTGSEELSVILIDKDGYLFETYYTEV
jgi:hypothetical protein